MIFPVQRILAVADVEPMRKQGASQKLGPKHGNVYIYIIIYTVHIVHVYYYILTYSR